ncbi:MAG: DUF4198 domain-containing protein [Bryobacteraceae bacterium]|nr:DUF4198 domain-containing protein [Bryobacteraceae bacterium]
MSRRNLRLIVAVAAAVVPVTLQAHRQWMLPSSTVLSNADSWITVDAAVSNELFYFDHVPMRLSNLVITGPDGAVVTPENAATGKYRSTFDVHLTQPGTYRIAQVNDTIFATWTENGERKNWRGSAAEFAKVVPANAEGMKKSRMSNRVEVFVTAGKPTKRALEPSGVGLELAPVTHPNDLVTGEAATFQLLMNGKPAAGMEITLIPGGIRYRDELHEMKCKTEQDGKFTFTFEDPGMYWLNATSGGGPRMGGPGGGQGPMRFPEGDRASYTATLEVLPQ